MRGLIDLLRAPDGRHVTIEQMSTYYEPDGSTRKKHQLDGFLKGMPEDSQWKEWANGSPVGTEFGAEHARFNRVHAQTLITFGNPLDAVSWLITNSSVLHARPMHLAIDSEEGCAAVLDVLAGLAQ
jgi:uncharacterized protein (DUF2384 family)